jgi:hypothetical protein
LPQVISSEWRKCDSHLDLPRPKRVEHIQNRQNSKSQAEFGIPYLLDDANLTPQLRGCAGAVADSEIPCLSLANGSGRIDGNSEVCVESVHQLADSAHQFLTGSGEGHGIATEDVEANICFKLLDLPTDIWLRNVKTLGGSAEVQLLSDGQYVLQFSERGRDAHTLGCL